MKVKLSDHEKLLYLLLDVLTLNIAFILTFTSKYQSINKLLMSKYLILYVFVNFVWLLVSKYRNTNLDNRRKKTIQVYFDFIKALFINLVLSLAFIALIQEEYSQKFIFKFYASFFFMGGLSRLFFNWYLKVYRTKGYNFRRMVVVGVNKFSINFVNEVIRHPEYGFKFLGFFGYNQVEEQNVEIQDFEEIHKFLLEFDIDDVYISLPSNPDYRIKELIKFCHLNYINVNFLNEFIHLLNKKTIQVDLDYNGPTPIVAVAKEPLELTTNKFLKRTFDLLFALGLIVFVFSWLFPILAIIIKISSPGPVFFKQKRTGIDNSAFYCYKFRTMKVNDESDNKQATEGDSRITKVGNFLRKSSLDELPQFINVLKGEMAVVGPRPHMLSHTKMYAKLIAPFMVRHWVKPGITGLAQAKGFRGETKEVRQMYQRVKMDVFYIQNWSFLFDIKIVFMTVWNMLSNKNTGA